MNLLVIPAWYPTKNNPLNGSFVREQSLIMEPEYNVKVLYPIVVGIRKIDIFKHFVSKNSYSVFDNFIPLSPPEAESIVCISHTRSDKRYFQHAIQKIEKSFLLLMESGWKPDLIHAHTTKWAGAYSVFLAHKYKIPTIITEHQGPLFLGSFSAYNKRLLIESLEKASLVLSVSNHQSRVLLSQGLAIHPQIVGNMVDDQLFELSSVSQNSDKFVIGTVSGADFYKDLDTFLKSLIILKNKKARNFQAIIISTSPLSEKHRAFIMDNDLSDVCRVQIGVTRNKMPEFYATCNVVVSTSIVETFGISVAEAICSGVPVISTRNGGTEDFVNESNGYLINIQDHEALSKILIQLMTNGFHKSPKQIRDTITSEFGREAFKKRLDTIYHRIVDKIKQ